MGIERMLRTPCTLLLRQGDGEDALGNPAPGEPVEVETKCSLQQRDRDEPAGAGETSVAEWNLTLPYAIWATVIDLMDRPLGTGDAVLAKGRTYEFVGDPWDADEGSRALWHVAATVKRVSGADDGAGS